MQILFTENAQKQLLYWKKQDSKIYAKIYALLNDIMSSPFSGLGKPEPLKFEHSGKWSRRISKEHRLVYEISAGKLIVYQCRYHY